MIHLPIYFGLKVVRIFMVYWEKGSIILGHRDPSGMGFLLSRFAPSPSCRLKCGIWEVACTEPGGERSNQDNDLGLPYSNKEPPK